MCVCVSHWGIVDGFNLDLNGIGIGQRISRLLWNAIAISVTTLTAVIGGDSQCVRAIPVAIALVLKQLQRGIQISLTTCQDD